MRNATQALFVTGGPRRLQAGYHSSLRYPVLLIIAVVLLIRLPFLNQAIQGDDVYYLAGAQHAQIDPFHPNHAQYVFLGQVVDMRGHPHPPLNVWVLGGLLAVIGDIREVPFHAAYMGFSLLAALAMWSLARRFAPERALGATLLFLATPAFVVNGNSFESDVPLLAFWLAGIAAFIRALDRSCVGWLALAALALAAAGLAAYQAVVAIPILWFYLWLKRPRWTAAWIASLSPALILAAWHLFEHVSTGALPARVLAGHMDAFQTLQAKLRSAAALTSHLGWIVFPGLVWIALRPRRVELIAVLAAAGGAALIDPHPLFWFCFATGVLVVIAALHRALNPQIDERFLAAWLLLFFAAALVLFFAGSARYLLPLAAPVAILIARSARPAWIGAAFALQLLLGLALSWVNYQHWNGYREFVTDLAPDLAQRRVWINGEWGLRYYAESEGGLALERGQPVRPGDVVLSSALGFPIPFATGGGQLIPYAERETSPTLPLRLIGLGTRSGYSAVTFGLRPFDLAAGPLDHVRAGIVIERSPEREYLTMDDSDAAAHIVSGVHELEQSWRWISDRAVFLLKRPSAPRRVRAAIYIPGQSPARAVRLLVNGAAVAAAQYAGEGSYTLESPAAVPVEADPVNVAIEVDATFTVPGDHRRLSLILSSIGFAP